MVYIVLGIALLLAALAVLFITIDKNTGYKDTGASYAIAMGIFAVVILAVSSIVAGSQQIGILH